MVAHFGRFHASNLFSRGETSIREQSIMFFGAITFISPSSKKLDRINELGFPIDHFVDNQLSENNGPFK